MPAVTAPDRATAAAFRPRRGRVVSAVIGVVTLVGAIALAASLPERFGIMDRLTCAGIGVAVAVFMSRFATIHACPTAEGLYVRNLGPGELVPWESMTAVRFSQGMPWPRIDLGDDLDVAVMAIQRSDGPQSVDEAQRLADLIGR